VNAVANFYSTVLFAIHTTFSKIDEVSKAAATLTLVFFSTFLMAWMMLDDLAYLHY